MSTILQGTTPALRIGVNENDFLVTDVVTLEIKIWQEKASKTLTYGLDDVEIDEAGNCFEIHFTEKDTLAMTAGKLLYWQMRCKFSDGSIVGTAISDPISVADLKSEEAIT